MSLADKAAKLLISIAATNGKSIDISAALALGEELLVAGASLLDGHAKQVAAAAGDAAAAKITTEDAAEAALRKP